MIRSLPLLAALLVACGGRSSSVEIGTFALEAKSTVAAVFEKDGSEHIEVYVSDLLNACEIGQQRLCTGTSVEYGPNYLHIEVEAGKPGTYPVGSSPFQSGTARVTFVGLDSSVVLGSVTISSIEANNAVSGSYDVKLAGGATVSGSFVAPPCANIQWALEYMGPTRTRETLELSAEGQDAGYVSAYLETHQCLEQVANARCEGGPVVVLPYHNLQNVQCTCTQPDDSSNQCAMQVDLNAGANFVGCCKLPS